MEGIQPLLNPNKKKDSSAFFKGMFLRLGNILEIVLILGLWIFIFSKNSSFGGFSREEMLTYIIIGNIIGMISSSFLNRSIKNDLKQNQSNLLLNFPFKYLRFIIRKSFGKNIFPFTLAISLNMILLFIFINNLEVNLEPLYIFTIIIMITLAFLTEFLLSVLSRQFVFWTFASTDAATILIRIRKLLAGNYLPLNLISPLFLQISLFLPFSYSFFVPTQLFLKKIDIKYGLIGLLIQATWIVLLFFLIKLVNKNKRLNDEIKK